MEEQQQKQQNSTYSIPEEKEEPEEEEEEEEEEEPEGSEMESSPLRSPHLPSHIDPNAPEKSQSTAIVAVDYRNNHVFTPLRSPPPPPPPPLERKPIQSLQSLQSVQSVQLVDPPVEPVRVNPLSPVIVVNRSIREELSVKVDPGRDGGGDRVEDGGDRKPRAVSSIIWRQRREGMVRKAALVFRVLSAVFCLVSFSVMSADRTQGWAGDSFDRYKEYRYCLSVAVIGFAYAGFQACDLAYHLISGKHVIQSDLRYFFDFSIDQILTYLLISASSAAASRVDDWQSNWGSDEFTTMASASIGMSFLAFASFAFSSLISGYNLCIRNYT